MIVLPLFLFGAAVCILFLFDEGEASRHAVSLLLGVSLLTTLELLLPPRWLDAIPRGFGRSNPGSLLGILLCYTICLPIVTHLLYPLRDRLLVDFKRRSTDKRR